MNTMKVGYNAMYCECHCNTLLRDSEHGAICLTIRGDEARGGLPQPSEKDIH